MLGGRRILHVGALEAPHWQAGRRGGRESSLGAGEAGWAKTRGGGPPAWLAVIDKPDPRYASYLSLRHIWIL